VGENRPRPVNVRVLSATNRDLERLLASGRMREDFFYRIKVVSLTIPPLRERREDIPLLVEELLGRISRRGGQDRLPEISAEAMARLMNHSWPGNVRELENALEHALVLSRMRAIGPEHLPPGLGRRDGAAPLTLKSVQGDSERERELLLEALAATGWNRTRAARRLGIDRSTLWRKLKTHRLQEPE